MFRKHKERSENSCIIQDIADHSLSIAVGCSRGYTSLSRHPLRSAGSAKVPLCHGDKASSLEVQVSDFLQKMGRLELFSVLTVV